MRATRESRCAFHVRSSACDEFCPCIGPLVIKSVDDAVRLSRVLCEYAHEKQKRPTKIGQQDTAKNTLINQSCRLRICHLFTDVFRMFIVILRSAAAKDLVEIARTPNRGAHVLAVNNSLLRQELHQTGIISQRYDARLVESLPDPPNGENDLP